jgi:VWFA-related protein
MPGRSSAGPARVLAALLAAASATAGAQAQQTQAPLFRTTTNLLVQPVTVTDKDGKPIEGLTAKDFVLTENDVVQTIAFCEYQRLSSTPVTSTSPMETGSAASAPVSPTAAVPPVTAERAALSGDAAYRGHRLLVLYFDLYNMPFFDQMRMYSAASTYIDRQMTADDLVAVMVFQRGAVRLRQNFTADRAALRELVGQLTQEANDDEAGGIMFDPGGAFGEDDDTFNLFSTDRQLAALQTAVTDLGPLPEIKTLVYFGSGLSLSGADNLAQLRATVNAAVRSSVTVNPVDTRGLVAAPPLGDATHASPSGVGLFNGAMVQAAVTRQQQSQDTYYALAKDTGGRAMFDNNDLSLGIVQAARAVTGYYMLGYYTTNTATDGKFRRITVTLADGRTADLSYRAGYYGPEDYSHFNAADKERQLEDALRAEDPITDIPMAAEVNYFQISSAEYFVPVSVRMPGSELTRPRPKGDTHAEIDMIGEVKDTYGVTIRNMRDKLEFTLDPAKAADVARRPIQYETGFSLLPGQYVLKMLARDTTTGRMGTFQTQFTVPNLEREHASLPISTVVMTSQRVTRADALYNVQQKISSDVANPLVFDGRKLVPSVTHTYSAGRPLYVFLQAYERDSTAVRALEAYVAFYRAGVKVSETSPTGFDEWDPKLRAVPIRFTLASGTLTPGTYDCQVTVLDPTANKVAFWRASVEIVR